MSFVDELVDVLLRLGLFIRDLKISEATIGAQILINVLDSQKRPLFQN